MPHDDILNITSQRHETYNQKSKIWQQVSDSYAGGKTYQDGDYLHKFFRENSDSYKDRQKRALYFNNTQPLSDMLVGFLIPKDGITRNKFKNQEVIDSIGRISGLDDFMYRVATNSGLYTTGVLVDSPDFRIEDVITEQDRIDKGLNPYTVLYEPWKILNFYFDANDILSWVLLDNSFIDRSNPYATEQKITKYTLWTREIIQHLWKKGSAETSDAEFTGLLTNGIGGTSPSNPGKTHEIKKDANSEWFVSEPFPHGQPEIPFIFVNWYDKNNTKYADTVFEDIAFFDQGIYNYMSLMDELITAGTFKFLFFPGTIPDEIKDSGFSNLAAIPYDPLDGGKPFFDGPKLDDINPFLNSIEFLLTGILRKLGLNTDQEKDYVQSGQAKFFDFKKTNALLQSASNNLEKTEKLIFKYYGSWIGKPDEDVEIKYPKDFLGVEQAEELNRMYQTIASPFDMMQQQAWKRIAEINFGGKIKKSEMNAIIKDIETTESEPIDINNLVDEEQNQEDTNNGRQRQQ